MRWLAPLAGSAALAVALATCAQPPGRRAAPQRGQEPDIRVAVAAGVASVRVGGQGDALAASEGRPAFRLAPAQAVTVAAEGRAVVVSGARTGRYNGLSVAPVSRDRFVTVNDRPYRGAIEIVAGSDGLTVVNVVSLEAYLAGVINAEMGRRAPNERAALEAQAIVSRTYALYHRGASGRGYDLGASASDQVYGGVATETAMGWEAVRATAGQVLTFDGRLIEAFFHSTCGSSTAAPEEVFRFGQPVPYLRPVSDRSGNGYYCDISPRFRWTVEWGGEELTRILRRTIPAALGIEASRIDQVRNVSVHRTGPSGRVVELRVTVGAGQVPVFGPDVRAVLEGPDGRPVGSTALRLRAERHGGALTRLVADGVGWGHGVGMCQWGAVGRARAGQDAQRIVLTYFPGTKVERWY